MIKYLFDPTTTLGPSGPGCNDNKGYSTFLKAPEREPHYHIV